LRARPQQRWLGAYVLLASAYAFGCSASSRDGAVVASDTERIVYGTDDRTEPYEDETSPSSLADAASNSTAVIVFQSDVQTSDDGSVRLDSGTLQDVYGVCATEHYADQPSAGFCTAMLVEPDVVLTAGHCLALMSCPRLALVFGFQYDSPGVLHHLTSSDVYGCAEVLLSKVSDLADSQVLDYAFIRLDRPVAPPLRPLRLDHSGAALAEGSAVSLVGHGGGLPTKIARHGVVTDGRPEPRDYFLATVDNYSGGSGSGVFDSQNRLVGIAVRGGDDFRTSGDGCQVSIRNDSGKGEQITYASRATEALCAKGNPVGGWCSGTPHAAAGCSVALDVGAHGRAAASWWFLLGLTGCFRFRRCPTRRAACGCAISPSGSRCRISAGRHPSCRRRRCTSRGLWRRTEDS
jgi:V8-like Glu-specific endopeptidase